MFIGAINLKKKMVFFTSSFPYGKGEKTFVMPELQKFEESYNIILISHAVAEEVDDEENKSILNNKIEVINHKKKVGLLRKIFWGICFLFDKDGITEIKDIVRSKKSVLLRIYQSLGFYILSMEEYQKLKREKILNEKAGILCYSYWYTYYCYALIRYKRKNHTLKVLTRTHGVDLYNERFPGERQPFKKIMDLEIDGVIFASQYAYRYYTETFSQQKKTGNYFVCRLGVPRSERQESVRGQVFCLVSCSYAVAIKRIHLIIEALSNIAEENIRWIHIGDGTCLPKLQAYAEALLGVKGNIQYEWKGYMNGEQIKEFYEKEQVDCFITTTATEGGCPVSIQEAMSYSVPIIGTCVGGVTEMIKGNGILLPEEPTAEAVKDAILNIYYMEEKERLEIGNLSFQIWEKDYNRTVNISNLLEKIDDIVKE